MRQRLEQDETGSYTLRQRYVDEPSTQVRIGKDRIGKDRLEYIDAEAPTPAPTTKKVKEPKKKYGAFENVLLTDDEYSKLKEQYSDIDERIERLSEYIASSGKSYKSHYATILSWARKDSERPQQVARMPYQRQRREEHVPEWAKQQPAPPSPEHSVNDEELPKRADDVRAKLSILGLSSKGASQ